jgi:alpha-1,2-mannosyltransferase
VTAKTGEKLGTPNTPELPYSRARGVSPGAVMAAGTLVALGIRLFTLTRPGFLTSPAAEYDDGVYLGAAIRLTQGVLPYRDFAFVQPPGILLLMSPVALIARVTSTAAGLGLARILTALASTACIPLAGNLVRHRGTLVTALTCGILAIYPSDIATAHTLLLEPWMNLLCLLGANAAFSQGRLATRPSRLAWAGIAIGFAAVVKFWAMAPAAVLLVVCLLAKDAKAGEAGEAGETTPIRVRRTITYLSGLALAFVVPLAPFMLSGVRTFFRSTVLYQAVRVGTSSPMALRLAHITGLIDVLNYHGAIAFAGANSLFAQAVVADTAPAHPHLQSFLVALVLGGILAAGLAVTWRGLTEAEWFALGTAVLALVAIGVYSAFFYHYPDFPAPWLAIVAGVALSGLAGRLHAMHAMLRPLAVGLVATVLAAAAILQLTEVAQLHLPPASTRITSMIPPGACVVTDQVSMIIAADRFDAARPGCPVIIDSLATTLVLTHGTSIQAGADGSHHAVSAWQRTLLKAQYVWLSPNVWRRIPWRAVAGTWFDAHFTPIAPVHGWIREIGQLFIRSLPIELLLSPSERELRGNYQHAESGPGAQPHRLASLPRCRDAGRHAGRPGHPAVHADPAGVPDVPGR